MYLNSVIEVAVPGFKGIATCIAEDPGYVCLKLPGKVGTMARSNGTFQDDDGKTRWFPKGAFDAALKGVIDGPL